MLKEFWVNEYETIRTKQRVFGAHYETRELAIANLAPYDKCVGRWHVKMKE